MNIIKINSPKYGVKNILVDDRDYKWLNGFNWWVSKRDGGLFRVQKNKTIGDSFRSMPRMIMNVTDKSINIDHIDKDTLNNQRNNLRICNASQSACNISSAKNATSKYLGVSFSKRETSRKTKNGVRSYTSPAWRALIHKDYKKIHLGWFRNENDAAKAYNEAAIKLHGEFASLNNIK